MTEKQSSADGQTETMQQQRVIEIPDGCCHDAHVTFFAESREDFDRLRGDREEHCQYRHDGSLIRTFAYQDGAFFVTVHAPVEARS